MSKSIDSRDIFLSGKHVFLKSLTRNDVIESNWYGWFNDEELSRTLQKHYFPNTLEAQMDFWEKNIAIPTNKIQLGICKPGDDKIIGIVSLNNIDYINRKCEFSIIIGEKKEQNIKLFVECCNLMFRHAFDTLNLNKVYGGSISKDLVMLMTRTLNCKQEGIAREDIYKDGEYKDAYLYSLLKKDFTYKS
ncbi:GNAT family N-acetyltransferase [Sediminibacterium roseum]|uniref:GNAT family N-acetyltransferase n=1 Tax=Sediminibacterium roseum TaxID=1978412 RepID=A0ABW9ZQ79_9BACT|nr:GNAT family protein [Sediminibacterium roseum]NCI49074.1 GNAT family N-acetyltransferase [Sediminibacterium roseum]